MLLDFWAIWCGPCRLIAPKLSALQTKYGAQGLTVVGITTDELAQATVHKERTQMRYSVVSDPTAATMRGYGVRSFPTLFVIDKRGVIRFKHVGPMTPEVLQTRVVPLLKELNG